MPTYFFRNELGNGCIMSKSLAWTCTHKNNRNNKNNNTPRSCFDLLYGSIFHCNAVQSFIQYKTVFPPFVPFSAQSLMLWTQIALMCHNDVPRFNTPQDLCWGRQGFCLTDHVEQTDESASDENDDNNNEELTLQSCWKNFNKSLRDLTLLTL